jgi:hypothetical protein
MKKINEKLIPRLMYYSIEFDKDGSIRGGDIVNFKIEYLVNQIFEEATKYDIEIGVKEISPRMILLNCGYECIRFSIKRIENDKYMFNWLRQNGEFQNHEEFETLEELKNLISNNIRDHEQDMKSRRKKNED